MSVVFAANWSKCATLAQWLQKFGQLGAAVCDGALNSTKVVYGNAHSLTSGTAALEVKVAVAANAILSGKVAATFSAYTAENRILEFQDANGNVLAYLTFSPALDGALTLYNAAGAALGKTPDKLSLNVVYNVECELNATAGTARIWLFGDPDDVSLSLSGLTFPANPAKVRVKGTTAIDLILHDIIIRTGDTTGLGNAFAESRMPAAVSSVSNFYASSGEIAAALAQSAPDGDPYVEAAASPGAMTVQFDDIDGDYPIKGVVVVADWRRVSDGNLTARLDTVIDGITTVGAVQSLTTSYVGYGTVVTGVSTQTQFEKFRAVVNRTS